MTISSSNRKAGPFVGNDVSTVFAFDFKVFSDDDFAVYKSNSSGVEGLLAEGADYVSSINPDQDSSPGGSITTTVPLATGETLAIIGNVANTQALSLVNGATMYPKNIETALDRVVCMIQQNTESISRSVMVNPSSTADPGDLIDDLLSAAASAESDAAAAVAAAASSAADAALLSSLKDYCVLAGAGGSFAVVSGVIRQTTALGGWEFINDSNHAPVNCSAVSVNASGNIQVDFARTFTKKSALIVGVDETYASFGISVGASVGNSSCTFEMYAPLGGTITASGIQAVDPLGHFISPDCTQTITASAGTLSVTHPSIPHTSGNGNAVMLSPVDSNCRWSVSSTKTGFDLKYTRRVAGYVNWSGGFPLLNTQIAYPAALTIASGANNGSGLYRLVFTTDHPFVTGHRTTISGTGTALDSGDAATLRSWEVTVINSTTVDLVGSTYSTPIASGSAAFTQVDWVTDHLEIFHPYTGTDQTCQITQWKSTTQYHITVDTPTSYKIPVWFYTTGGVAVTAKSSQMKIMYLRDTYLPAIIPATAVGQVQRSDVHCHADYVYSANGNLWFIGIFEE